MTDQPLPSIGLLSTSSGVIAGASALLPSLLGDSPERSDDDVDWSEQTVIDPIGSC